MTITCPTCRHVVDLGETASCKCPNCGEVVSAPVSATAPPAPLRTDPATVPAPQPPTVAVTGASETPAPSPTRAASIVAFVGGLLFCVPFVTQVLGICAALFAVLRRRLPNERVALAWVGLILSVTALSAWGLLTLSAMTASTNVSFFTPVRRPARTDVDGWEQTSALIDEMKRIHRAATAYYRDYKRWPDGVEPLVGRSLPRRFTMSPRLTYRPVPSNETYSTDWVLIVSGVVLYDTDGESLDSPHRIVLRLNGKIEVLPDAEVKKLLASQPTE